MNITTATLADYLRIAHRHLALAPKDPVERLRFLSLALCGESGELANIVKKEWRGDKTWTPEYRAKAIGELADVANYAFMIADQLGIDLLLEAHQKFLSVEQRPEFAAVAAQREGTE